MEQRVVGSRRSPSVIDVVVVDDHDLVAAGMVRLLDASPSTRVVARCHCGEELLRRLGEGLRADVCLVDLSMPGLGGASTIAEVASRPDGPVCIALTASTTATVAAHTLQCGAVGFVTKAQPPEVLLDAIRICAAGGTFVDPVVGDALEAGGAAARSLSAREFEVLSRLARGERIADIAADLFLSPKTVSTHRRRILDKLGLSTNVELAAYASDHGMVER